MGFKIDIPTKLSDITLRQYKHFLKIEKQNKSSNFVNSKMIEIFCNVSLKDVLRLKVKDSNEIISILTKLFDDKPNLVKKFKVNKTEFGFHPSMDELTFGEYIDLDTYIGDWDNMEKAMNVLYRPVLANLKNKYAIVEYDAELNEKILDMPMNAVMGSIFFLWNLGLDLSKAMMKSLDQEQVQDKALTDYLYSMQNGDGINLFSVDSLKEILDDLKISLN